MSEDQGIKRKKMKFGGEEFDVAEFDDGAQHAADQGHDDSGAGSRGENARVMPGILIPHRGSHKRRLTATVEYTPETSCHAPRPAPRWWSIPPVACRPNYT